MKKSNRGFSVGFDCEANGLLLNNLSNDYQDKLYFMFKQPVLLKKDALFLNGKKKKKKRRK